MSSSIKLKNANGKTVSVTNSNANQTDKEIIYLNTVDELANASGSINAVAIVSDLSRGGTFEWSATGTANGGTVFAGVSGYWNRQYSGAVSVKWFGAKGDGVADDTSNIQNAINFTASIKTNLFFPQGSYIVTGLNAIINMSLIGEGSNLTKIKLKDSSNTHLINSLTNNIDEVKIEGISFDGNRGNNTNGDGLRLYGSKHQLIDVRVVNIPENGIVSNWQGASFRTSGFEGFYSNITIDSCGKSGWVYQGASDSHFESIYIIDTGLSLTNTYYGLYLESPSGNGRFFNVHTWNRSDKTIVAKDGVHVKSSGNNFAGCHFEGSTIPLTVVGSGNTFSSCSYYAPRGLYCVDLAGGSNIIEGSIGLTAYANNLNYIGVLLTGGTNQLNLVDTGCLNGSVYFNDASTGLNTVLITGNKSGVGYGGTPSKTDTVNINLGGTSNTKFYQLFETDWNTYVPVLTPETGAFIDATATGKYKKVGSLVFVTISITITNKGTASGSISARLPIDCKTANIFSGSGRERAITGKSITGSVETQNVRLFLYDNNSAIATGAIITTSFFYESA